MVRHFKTTWWLLHLTFSCCINFGDSRLWQAHLSCYSVAQTCSRHYTTLPLIVLRAPFISLVNNLHLLRLDPIVPAKRRITVIYVIGTFHVELLMENLQPFCVGILCRHLSLLDLVFFCNCTACNKLTLGLLLTIVYIDIFAKCLLHSKQLADIQFLRQKGLSRYRRVIMVIASPKA